MVIWLGRELCLMFVVDTGGRSLVKIHADFKKMLNIVPEGL